VPRHRFKPGHPRFGGIQKGQKHHATLEKEAAREHLLRRVVAEIDGILDAQIAASKGLKFLVLRDRTTGKFIRLAEAKARKLAEKDYELVEVWERLPSTAASADLLNRALDKPKEQPLEHHVQGEITLKQAILSARGESNDPENH
jgi:hypothetical protein